MNRLAAVLIRAYPPAFRERYGGELAALVDDTGMNARSALDLLVGALRAWLRPPMTGPEPHRRRMQATAATVWVCWCAGFLIAPTANRWLLDPPVPGVTRTVHDLLDASAVLMVLGWGVAVLGAAPVLVRAARDRQWSRLRPLLIPVVLGAVAAALLLVIALLRRAQPAPAPHLGSAIVALVVVWAVIFLAFVIALGLAPASTLTRLAPSAVALRWPAMCAVAVTCCLTAMSATALAAVLVAASSGPLISATLAVACAASIVAVVSSARGARTTVRDH